MAARIKFYHKALPSTKGEKRFCAFSEHWGESFQRKTPSEARKLLAGTKYLYYSYTPHRTTYVLALDASTIDDANPLIWKISYFGNDCFGEWKLMESNEAELPGFAFDRNTRYIAFSMSTPFGSYPTSMKPESKPPIQVPPIADHAVARVRLEHMGRNTENWPRIIIMNDQTKSEIIESETAASDGLIIKIKSMKHEYGTPAYLYPGDIEACQLNPDDNDDICASIIRDALEYVEEHRHGLLDHWKKLSHAPSLMWGNLKWLVLTDKPEDLIENPGIAMPPMQGDADCYDTYCSSDGKLDYDPYVYDTYNTWNGIG